MQKMSCNLFEGKQKNGEDWRVAVRLESTVFEEHKRMK